jgi:hypothetical protein
MTIVQHSQIQNLFKYFETLQSEEIEQAFLSHWKPFVFSLSSEEDRALAFKLLYEWQTAQTKTFLEFLQTDLPEVAVA